MYWTLSIEDMNRIIMHCCQNGNNDYLCQKCPWKKRCNAFLEGKITLEYEI